MDEVVSREGLRTMQGSVVEEGIFRFKVLVKSCLPANVLCSHLLCGCFFPLPGWDGFRWVLRVCLHWWWLFARTELGNSNPVEEQKLSDELDSGEVLTCILFLHKGGCQELRKVLRALLNQR